MILYDIQNDSFVNCDTSQVRLYGQELGGSIIDSLVHPFLEFYASASEHPISEESDRLINWATCTDSIDAIFDPSQPLFSSSYQNVPILTLSPVRKIAAEVTMFRKATTFAICEICSPFPPPCLIVSSFPSFPARRFPRRSTPISLSSPCP